MRARKSDWEAAIAEANKRVSDKKRELEDEYERKCGKGKARSSDADEAFQHALETSLETVQSEINDQTDKPSNADAISQDLQSAAQRVARQEEEERDSKATTGAIAAAEKFTEGASRSIITLKQTAFQAMEWSEVSTVLEDEDRERERTRLGSELEELIRQVEAERERRQTETGKLAEKKRGVKKELDEKKLKWREINNRITSRQRRLERQRKRSKHSRKLQ